MKTISRLTIGLATIVGISAFCGQTRAQQGPLAEIREALEKLDANGDQTIERNEVPASGRAAFDRLLERVDHNKNKKLEIEERRELFEKLRPLADPGVLADRFQGLDKDADGKLIRSEFPGENAQFARLDANGDGKLSREEFLKRDAPARTPAKPATSPPPAPNPGLRRQRIQAMDKNGDGKISKAEWQGMPQVFERLDKNNDGVISGDELPKGGAS